MPVIAAFLPEGKINQSTALLVLADLLALNGMRQ